MEYIKVVVSSFSNKDEMPYLHQYPCYSAGCGIILVLTTYDWTDSMYGPIDEDIPKDLPLPLGKPVVTVSYVDANLMHDLTTGRSVTGVLHFLNATPINWYSKKMSTVEIVTYAAEFISAHTCIE
jgi:hypothetical protein